MALAFNNAHDAHAFVCGRRHLHRVRRDAARARLEALAPYWLSGKSHDELAAMFGCSRSTISRAMKRLTHASLTSRADSLAAIWTCTDREIDSLRWPFLAEWMRAYRKRHSYGKRDRAPEHLSECVGCSAGRMRANAAPIASECP